MIIRWTWLSTTRACLKKAFRELRVSVCGRFYPNEGGVAGYGNRTKVKYTAKWGLQIAEMIFQTRSSNPKAPKSMIFCPLVSLYCIWIVQEKCSKKCQRHIDSRLPFSFSHFTFLPTILSCNFPGYKPHHISKTCT